MYPSDASRMPARASAARTSPSTCRTLEECPHCHELKLPHHVCPNCGYYHGRLAVEPQACRRHRRRRRADRGDRASARRRPRRGPAASASPSTRWAATTARPRSSPARSTTPARHPDDQLILVGDEATVRGIAGAAARPTSRSSTPAQVIGMDEHPALALREKKDASILVATRPRPARRGRRRRDRRSHRRRHGRGDPAPRAACPASTGRRSRSR